MSTKIINEEKVLICRAFVTFADKLLIIMLKLPFSIVS